MSKILLVYVLFFVVANATSDMVKKNTSKLLSDLSIMFSSLTIILIMFIVITVIIICTKKVLLIAAYKLWDLSTTYREMCATLVKKIVGVLLLIYVQVFEEFEMDNMHLNNVIQQHISFT